MGVSLSMWGSIPEGSILVMSLGKTMFFNDTKVHRLNYNLPSKASKTS